MAYDEDLADRIRRAVKAPDITEKKMFGGIAFMSAGKMFIGVIDAELMVRVGPEGHDAALARPHVRPMDFTGKPMRGYVYVGPEGATTVAAVKRWVEEALAFVKTLPDKAPKAAAKPRAAKTPADTRPAGARTRKA